MKHNYSAILDKVAIRPLKKDDIEILRSWRNNRNLSTYLTPVGEISKEQQLAWFEKYISDESCIFFVIDDLERAVPVGTVAIYEIRNDSAYIGKILIGDESAHGKGIGYVSIMMAMTIGFHEIGISQFYLNGCEDNIPAYKLYKKIGFYEIGSHPFGDGLVEMEMKIDRTTFEQHNKNVNNIRVDYYDVD